VGSKGTSNKLYPLKKNTTLGLIFLFSWFIISVVFPFFILVVQSFKTNTDKFIQAFDLLSPTIGDSFGLAFIAALIIVFIGFTAAYFFVRKPGIAINTSFDWMMLIVFALPSIVFAISLITFYNHPALDFIYSSYAIIVIAFVGKFSFVATKLIANSIKQVPVSFDEEAEIEGVTPFKRLQKILIPLIVPSLFVSFVISFIFCFSELGTSIMLYPPGTELMPIKVFTIMANAPQALISSMTLIVFSITLFIITIFYFISKALFKNSR
jgi:ABC-type Fe3+ transport system permease subunit